MQANSGLTKRFKRAASLFFLLIFSGCVGPIAKPAPAGDEPAVAVYLVDHGWHSGLVIPRAGIPEDLWPESGDFPDADYLEVGWGDRDYYQAPQPGVWMALKAAFWPTSSVLHVIGLKGPLTRYYPHSEIIELKPSIDAFRRLCRFIHDSYQRDGPRAAPISPLAHPISRFYPARGSFHLLRTCNAWTATALRAAGYPIGAFSAVFSSTLVSRSRGFGKPIR